MSQCFNKRQRNNNNAKRSTRFVLSVGRLVLWYPEGKQSHRQLFSESCTPISPFLLNNKLHRHRSLTIASRIVNFTFSALCNIFAYSCLKLKPVHNITWVRSIGKSGLRFETPDFGFAIEREIQKQILTLRYLFLGFFSFLFFKGFEKLFFKNSGLARARVISKKKTTVHENTFAFLFRISQSNGKIAVHQIRIWIS